ncbi:MAG: GH116 family glycosyl-hydrolase [candidate division KSB1 bacterium]|nr:GH116 family glycosyl-hydrolase [candidate division KSB1 bacterium]
MRGVSGRVRWSTAARWVAVFVVAWTMSTGWAVEIRHRCGTAVAYRDRAGQLWEADRAFRPGSWGYLSAGVGTATTADEISGTLDDELYRTERYGPDLHYRYEGLDNGVYRILFKFCELYWTAPGRRVFDVAVNGLLFLDDFDIFSQVGHDAALDTSVFVRVRDGRIDITVPEVKVDYAKFAAIAIVPAVPDDQPPSVPEGLRGSFWQGRIWLSWKRNREPDLDGYQLQRAVGEEGAWEALGPEIIKGVSAIVRAADSAVVVGRTYRYRVRALDVFGNASPWSEPVTVIASRPSEQLARIPEVAWTRPIGDYPVGATGHAKRGVPLGGIGAGNFMFNLCGTFGPWEFRTGLHEEKFLSAGAFHLWIQQGHQAPQVATLATEDVLPAWRRLLPGEGIYAALYPKAWFLYHGLPVEVALRHFTPVIPHNYRESSFPVAVFEAVVRNATTETVRVAFALTFPNADYGDWPRYGKRSVLRTEGDILGVILDATSPSNRRATEGTEWCIATRRLSPEEEVSYCTSWNGRGDGADFYTDFGDDGLLSNRSLHPDAEAAAIAVRKRLAPGEVWSVPFALAWDFPIVEFGAGTQWYRRYTEYFDTQADNSFDIASEALRNYTNWEAMVDAWQDRILSEPCYPDWLKQAALNELYYDTFGGVFWENGCLTKPEESSYGTLPPSDHKYFSMECQAYPFCETFDVRHYECRHYLVLWPEIERDVLRWFADYIANDPDGKAPHDAGMPSQDPFFRFSGYGGDWQDMPSKFIQQVYAYYRTTRDRAFLDFVWPACKKTFAYMKTKDTNGNGLPDVGNTTYDAWGFHGDNLLASGLWIGALEALEQLAEEKGDGVLLNDVRRRLSLARVAANAILWVEGGGYYRLDQTSDVIMADGLNGSRYCETNGLPPILPPERMASHLHKVFELCVAPLRDFTGDGVGDMGAVNGRRPDGTAVGNGQADEVWTGSSYFVAAMMYHWGKELGDELLCQRALQTAYGVYYQTWVNEETAYFFNTPEAWHFSDPRRYRAPQYQRPRAIWELLLEIKDPFAGTSGTESPPEASVAPGHFTLLPGCPNPFNEATALRYRLPWPARVTVQVFDSRGREVERLFDGPQAAGWHLARWSPRGLPSGVYVCRIRAARGSEEYVRSVKLVLVR